MTIAIKSLKEMHELREHLGRISDLLIFDFSEADKPPTEIIGHVRQAREELQSGIDKLAHRIQPEPVGAWLEGERP